MSKGFVRGRSVHDNDCPVIGSLSEARVETDEGARLNAPAQEKDGHGTKDQSTVEHQNVALYKAISRSFTDFPPSVLISTFFINLLGLALPLVILQVYDRILPNQSVETLSFLIVGLCGVVIIEGAMKIARAYVMSWAALKTGFLKEVQAVSGLLKANTSDYAKQNPQAWLDGVDALSQLNGFYGGPSRLILLDLPFALIFLTITALVGGVLVLVPLTVITVIGYYIFRKGRRLQELLQERSEHDNRRFDFIAEVLSGIRGVKSMAMEPQMLRRFERLQQSAARVSFRTVLHSNHVQSVGNLFSNVSMVAMVSTGALLVMNGQLSIGALACCTLLSGRVVQPVLKGISIWSELQNVAVARRRAQPLMAMTGAGVAKQQARSDSLDDKDRSEADVKGAISLRNVTLQKVGEDRLTFDRLNLNVPQGHIVGIRGGNGSGRTLLLRLIRGDVVAEKGSVYIDGQNINAAGGKGLCGDISYLSADAPTFQGTLIENITMFRGGIALKKARNAARLIGLEDLIHQLPEGYDTPIGRGVVDVLSEGLKQLISIARVLTNEPKIILFDEANSMLDLHADQRFREGFEKLKGKSTIVIVSNRPSFLAIADKVFELKNGGLVEVAPDGTPIVQPHASYANHPSGGQTA